MFLHWSSFEIVWLKINGKKMKKGCDYNLTGIHSFCSWADLVWFKTTSWTLQSPAFWWQKMPRIPHVTGDRCAAPRKRLPSPTTRAAWQRSRSRRWSARPRSLRMKTRRWKRGRGRRSLIRRGNSDGEWRWRWGWWGWDDEDDDDEEEDDMCIFSDMMLYNVH